MGAGAGVLCAMVGRTSSAGSGLNGVGLDLTCGEEGTNCDEEGWALAVASCVDPSTFVAVAFFAYPDTVFAVFSTTVIVSISYAACGKTPSLPASVLRYLACGSVDLLVGAQGVRFLLFLDPGGRPLFLGTRMGI